MTHGSTLASPLSENRGYNASRSVISGTTFGGRLGKREFMGKKSAGSRGPRKTGNGSAVGLADATVASAEIMTDEAATAKIADATSLGVERVGTGEKAEVPGVGAVVRCRTRTYQVEAVEAPGMAGGGTVVRMFCLDDDAEGRRLDVVWEHELDTRILDREAWESLGAKGFDSARLFAAYYRTQQWNCITTTDRQFFQAPFRAGIKIDLYQLEPLRKALLLPRVNLFIADDVGLGKTIEAGLIARELLLRKRVESIIVVAPPSVVEQWQDEMTHRFGLRFEILDRAYVQRVREERGFGVNPWETYPYILISERLLIDDAYKAPLMAWLGAFRPKSMLILDEAHHVAPSSGSKYAKDSDLTRAVRDLAPRFEHRLFLSATPHNGHTNSFSALLEILDKNRFLRGTKVDKRHRDEIMVRRVKDQVRRLCGGFPERKLVQIDLEDLPPDTPELRLSELLAEYKRLRRRKSADASMRERSQLNLILSGLQQRLLSSIEAFANTLAKHRRGMEKVWQGEVLSLETRVQKRAILGSYNADDDEADLDEKDLAAIEDDAFEKATRSVGKRTPADIAEERRLLDEMERIANKSRHLPDARIKNLVRWIREHLTPGARLPGEDRSYDASLWTNERVIIFTEYEDTRRYIEQSLRAAIDGTDAAAERIAALRGATSRDRRELLKRAFNAPPESHPLRILVCTESAREGINLQNHCTHLFHFDLPWNPARVEQRNGRIDRKGQPAPVVWCSYFFYPQRKEDPVLAAIVKKSENIRQELGGRYKVVEQRLAERLEAGIDHDDLDATLFDIQKAGVEDERSTTTKDELEDAASLEKLEAELDRLRPLLEESKERIRFSPRALEDTVSAALEFITGNGLSRSPENAATDLRQFPADACLASGGASWEPSLDTLRRAPLIEDTTPPEFRRRSRAAESKDAFKQELLPVVFREKKHPDEPVVQLHLEHPIVQRLLGRFRAQGFRHHDLSRACLATSDTAYAHVILFGRLSLFGAGAARLHEEMIVTAARWSHDDSTKGRLDPAGPKKALEILELFERTIADPQAAEVPQTPRDRYQSSIARDGRALRPHLESVAQKKRSEAEAQLEKRGQAEADAIRKAIERQRERARDFVAKHSDEEEPSLPGMPQDELRQLRLDVKACRRYLDESVADLIREPDRIRDFYRVRTWRLEPIGLTYLHPVSG